MSDHRTDSDIEQALTQWAQLVAPNSLLGRLLESTFVHTMGAKQVRVYPWQRLIPGSRRLSHSGIGAGFAVALLTLLIVVAVGAGFVGGALRPTATPSPSPSSTPAPTIRPTAVPSPELPAAISVVANARVDVTGPIAMVSDGELLWALAVGSIGLTRPLTQSPIR